MTRKRGMATAFAAACLVLAGCAGPLNLMQESIYCDDARIAQGFDTYTVANRTGSLFDRKIGGLTGLETWLRISVPNEGGEFRVDYDATVSDGDFKIVFVDEKNVDTVCEGTARGSRVFTLDRGEYALKAVGRMRVPKSPSNCKRAKASPPLPRVTRSTTTRQWISNRLKADAADLPAWTRMRFHKKRTTA